MKLMSQQDQMLVDLIKQFFTVVQYNQVNCAITKTKSFRPMILKCYNFFSNKLIDQSSAVYLFQTNCFSTILSLIFVLWVMSFSLQYIA